jgi:Na+/H+ antiporter NhaD/arsenite permease-like protein
MVGASANVVTLGIAEAAGYRIRFLEFMKIGFVFMVISVGLANAYLLLFY